VAEELERARARLAESLTGHYDLDWLADQRIMASKEDACSDQPSLRFDLADYTHPAVRIADVPHKGRRKNCTIGKKNLNFRHQKTMFSHSGNSPFLPAYNRC
jgi:hypothetical protein